MGSYDFSDSSSAIHEKIHDMVRYHSDDVTSVDLIQLALAARVLDCGEEALVEIVKNMNPDNRDLFSRMRL